MVLERDLAGDIERFDQTRQGREHGGRAAANNPRRALSLLQPASQEFGHEPSVPGRTVVSRNLDVDSHLAEIIDPRQQRGGAHAIEQGRRGR